MSETVNVRIMPDDTTRIISRELTSLALAVGASLLIVLIQRKVSDPDFVLTCRMRTLNSIARYADTRASFWRTVSDKATKAYLESRP
jgi:hypothetical protein